MYPIIIYSSHVHAHCFVYIHLRMCVDITCILRNDLRKSLKKSREKEKEKDRKMDHTRDKDRGKEKKEQEVKVKGKGRTSDKDYEQKLGKERARDLEKRTEKILVAGKPSSPSEEKAGSGIRDPAKNRPQQTRLKKSSCSSSDSKTPTSPPTPATKPPSKSKTPHLPRTPPTPVGNDTAESPILEEKSDVQLPQSQVTHDHMKQSEDKLVRRSVGLESTDIPETPESPPAHHQGEQHQKLESDLSSGEEFPESHSGSPMSPHNTIREAAKKEKFQRYMGREIKEKTLKKEETTPVKFRMKVSSQLRTHSVKLSSGVASPTAQWSPDSHSSLSQSHVSSPPPQTHYSLPPTNTHRSPPPPLRLSGEESDDGSRKSRKLPRCYQLEDERLRGKQREMKEHRHSKPHPPPSTPSPPPAYITHRRHPPHSPPPGDYERRWRQRGRHFSPGSRPRRSPPGYRQSPPPTHGRGRSPYSNSPPPRPRTPIQRPRDRGAHRHRYESPPYDMPRGKHVRRGSSPMRHLSPSPPLLRPRSPGPGRRHQRRYSRSPSPPRRSPLRRKERTPSPGSRRSSPPFSDDRLDARKYSKRPSHPVHSRSPSPKPKRGDGPPRDEYPESKRRRVEGPPLTKEELVKPSKSDKQSPRPPFGGSSERHTPHYTQQRYAQGSTQGGSAHGTPPSRPSHYPASQSKTESSPSVATPSSAVASNTVSANPPQSQQPTDNLMDLLR